MKTTDKIIEIGKQWGIKSHHSEWSDEEALIHFAEEIQQLLSSSDYRRVDASEIYKCIVWCDKCGGTNQISRERGMVTGRCNHCNYRGFNIDPTKLKLEPTPTKTEQKKPSEVPTPSVVGKLTDQMSAEECKHKNTTWVGSFSICEDCGETI